MAKKFAASYSEILYHTTHASVKLFRDSCIQASSLPKLYSFSLNRPSCTNNYGYYLKFSKVTLMQIIKLSDIERVGVDMYTVKHFIIQLSNMSHTWPRNPHDYG